MKKLSLLFICALTIASCEKDVITDEVSLEEPVQNFAVNAKQNNNATMQNNNVAKQGNNVAVCHKNGKIIFVNENALSAHIAHGDAVDLDGDDFFDKENSCSVGVDCDDTNADVNPDAEEIFTDDIDNNCNGIIGRIEVTVERIPCTDCKGGTSGIYKRKKGSKCGNEIINENWEDCGTIEVVEYID